VDALLGELLKPHEIRNWERTGALTFDRPVTEDYAKQINKEIRDRILREDIIRRSPQGFLPSVGRFAAYTAGLLPGVLLDPLMIAIDAGLFWLIYTCWSLIERRTGSALPQPRRG
jgi:hypothetical protein